MIKTTNPHYSQNRVSRDSLPTQSSNYGYLLMATKGGQLIVFLCNEQWTVLYDWPSLATILQPFNSVIGLLLTDSNHSMRCVHFSCRQLILLTNFLRFLEFRRHSSKRKTICNSIQFWSLKSVQHTYLTSGENGGQCLNIFWLTFGGIFRKMETLVFKSWSYDLEFTEKFPV